MMVLTLKRPWAWAVLRAGKRVENRAWAPPPRFFGRRIAIHEGQGWDEEGAHWIESALGIEVPAWQQHAPGGVVVATALLVNAGRDLAIDRWATPRAVHWLLDGVREVRVPVLCRGRQGLRALPPDVLEQVLAREVAIA